MTVTIEGAVLQTGNVFAFVIVTVVNEALLCVLLL